LPVISIIGYTNTGKSTLLNTLTKSSVLTADMPFATLDPSSKRLRFPKEIEVIITDTVGFIRDLPKDLKAAFAATLEELMDADLLLEVIDLTDGHTG
jgi:GTP-binding protein HflX